MQLSMASETLGVLACRLAVGTHPCIGCAVEACCCIAVHVASVCRHLKALNRFKWVLLLAPTSECERLQLKCATHGTKCDVSRGTHQAASSESKFADIGHAAG